MSPRFSLHCSWSRRAEPDDFDPGDFLDAPALAVAMQRFVADYDGHVDVCVDSVILRLDLRADLALVLDDLPATLDRLAADENAEVELYFPEPGSDLALTMHRSGVWILIAVRRGELSGAQFAHLPDELPPVPVAEFVGAWPRCLGALLDAVAEHDPSLPGDPAYSAYRRRLEALADAPV